MGDIFDRLSRGPGSMQQQDYDSWNEMVGSAPQDRFHNSSHEAVRQMDPDDYYQHTQPGIGGTDPLGSLMPQQRSGIAQSLLGALTGRGIGQRDISSATGLRNIDPNNMSPQELAALLQYTQRNHPEALSGVANQYRDQPDLLQSIMGNKALMMLVAGLGAKFLNDRMQGQQRSQQQQGFGFNNNNDRL